MRLANTSGHSGPMCVHLDVDLGVLVPCMHVNANLGVQVPCMHLDMELGVQVPCVCTWTWTWAFGSPHVHLDVDLRRCCIWPGGLGEVGTPFHYK